MRKYDKDLVGQVFGRLTVIGRAPDRISKRGDARHYWTCQCSCGNVVERRDDGLLRGTSVSCGCSRKERMSTFMKERMAGKVIYGDSRERIHNIWYLMKYRCEDKTSPSYDRYGGRGIYVCEEWSDGIDGYFRFKEWSLANGYSEDLTLDRIDNDSGYSPDNCRWVDMYIQGNNKRTNRMVEYAGRTQTLSEWSRELGINMKVLHRRLDELGWDVNRAFTQPVRNVNK